MSGAGEKQAATWRHKNRTRRFAKKRPYTEKNTNLKRGGSYRQKYFEQNEGISIGHIRGLYPCPYCGKIMKDKAKITVDHIVPVRAVQRDKRLREKYGSMPGGVNHASNLAACCRRCNGRKGAKTGGLWLFVGRHGHKFMPAVRAAVITAIMYGAFQAITLIRDGAFPWWPT